MEGDLLASYVPSYLHMSRDELVERVDKARALLKKCSLCPRGCGVDRLSGERGFCRGGRLARISSYAPHFGEEPPLVGTGGSGTIFLAGCNLGCVFCQNYEISQEDDGIEIEAEHLAMIMVYLQELGCHNMNFVTPTHFMPQILEALVIARDIGLKVPLIYNCGGYESLETLKLLDGIFDIYMPDIKYGSDEMALKYSKAPVYVERCQDALREMHRQAGDLKIENGLARRGLLVRHLVLPCGIAGTPSAVKFLRGLSKDTYLNVMAQYRPAHKAGEYPEVNRPITTKEYKEAVKRAIAAGLTRGLDIY
jgi:putative pyruvate formate lyase activating enzyme